MIARIEISDYVRGRYNDQKLEKLKTELEKLFGKAKTREHQEYPKDGVLITISMSAKYGTLYVKCEEWGKYLAVGEFEELVKEAIENRGFEISDDSDGDEESFKIHFE